LLQEDINLEKIKVLGGGVLKQDGLIKEGRDKKTIIEIT
jgi:hypothetical protein